MFKFHLVKTIHINQHLCLGACASTTIDQNRVKKKSYSVLHSDVMRTHTPPYPYLSFTLAFNAY